MLVARARDVVPAVDRRVVVAVRATVGVRVAGLVLRGMIPVVVGFVVVALGITLDVVRADTVRFSVIAVRPVFFMVVSPRGPDVAPRSWVLVGFWVLFAREPVVVFFRDDTAWDVPRRTAARAASVPSSAIAP